MSLTALAIVPFPTAAWRAEAEYYLKLLAAWICGLIWGLGALTLTHSLLYNLYGQVGLVRADAPMSWQPFQGLIALVLGPALLGLVFRHRRWGLVGGLIALPAWLLAPVIWYIVTATTHIVASRFPALSDFDLLERAMTDWIPFLLAQWLATALMVWLVMRMGVPGSTTRVSGLRLGLAISLLLTVIGGLAVIALQQAALNSWLGLWSFHWGPGVRAVLTS